jgi:hypothetical protein
MDYRLFIKKLVLPSSFETPRELTFDDIRATAISREHLQEDVKGINESIELIQRTRGGRWPTEPVTAAGNFVDLVWHEAEFRDGGSFTYVVHDLGSQYLGCCYLYPMGRRTELTEALLNHDVDVSWWVTPTAYAQGHYAKLYAALRRWLADSFPFKDPYYSNHEIPTADTTRS